MSKVDEARNLLAALQVPEQQSNVLCGYTLLAMAGLAEKDPWSTATNEWLRIHDVIIFIQEHYSQIYAENTRETFRKQAMHHFRNAAFIEDNAMVTNSPNYRYRLTPEMLQLIRSFGTEQWNNAIASFLSQHPSLIELYSSQREGRKIPILINGSSISFSLGKHNQLQKAILEEFVPNFVPEAECLYVGDSEDRTLFVDQSTLRGLGLEITPHSKMPDVVLYSREKNWIIFVEAVTTVGPMDPKRVLELKDMTSKVNAGKVYITAFPDRKTFNKFAAILAWESEVWIADEPRHMIHYNGDRFMGPRD